MPFVALLFVALAGVLLLIPVSLVLRYRAGTKRRLAKGWIAVFNLAALVVSIALYLAAAAFASVWAPGALTYALGGLLAGGVLGVAGLALTRWESTPRGVHFTPNAWLVLVVTLVVAARLAYGVWRMWHAGFDPAIVAEGTRGSLAAGGIVLGYYAMFWLGVRRALRRRQRI